MFSEKQFFLSAIPRVTVASCSFVFTGEDNSHVICSKNTLVIDNVKRGDEGTYTCMASNQAGSVTKNITLVIEGRFASLLIYSIILSFYELPRMQVLLFLPDCFSDPPNIVDLPPQSVNEGDNVTWTCVVKGNLYPRTEPLWFKNSSLLREVEGKLVCFSATAL